MVEKSLGAWIDLLRQEMHKEYRRDECVKTKENYEIKGINELIQN